MDTLMVIRVLVNEKQLAEIKRYGMMLIKELPGGLGWEIWEPSVSEHAKNETEDEGCR